jgi:hypothetical protein
MRSTHSALASCSDSERASILAALVDDDPRLRERAEAIAKHNLTTVDVTTVSDLVAETILDLDTEDLANRAGARRDGYVEPTDAAWQLLEEAIEPWIEDLRRRGRLGFNQAATDLATAMTRALETLDERADRIDDCLLRQWATDFPFEAMSWVERELDAIVGPTPTDSS